MNTATFCKSLEWPSNWSFGSGERREERQCSGSEKLRCVVQSGCRNLKGNSRGLEKKGVSWEHF